MINTRPCSTTNEYLAYSLAAHLMPMWVENTIMDLCIAVFADAHWNNHRDTESTAFHRGILRSHAAINYKAPLKNTCNPRVYQT